MLKKGCAIAAVVLLAVYGFYLWLLWGRIETFPVFLLSGFGAIGFLMFFSQLKEVVFGPAGSAALKRAEKGLPLEDGAEEAVWGPIRPLGAPLEAPFSGRACVAYEYDAKPGGDEGASTMAGFGLAPSVIHSHRGDVHLLGFSMLEQWKEKRFDDPEARERATRWAASTEFREMGLAKVGAMFSALDEVMADDDGSVRMDMRTKEVTPDELAACTLKEKVILPGETVTAVGIWDAAKGGLVPRLRGKSTIVRVTPGGGAAAVVNATKRPWGTLAFAIVWAGFAHAIIALVVLKFPR
jgi:hypothetical protein